MDAFKGVNSTPARKAGNIIALNAGAAIYLSGVAATLADGVAMARQQLESGAALEKMEQLAAFSQQLAQEQA
jgi:anthranilate phosphoribosyltransferase